ncbi:POU-domain protein pdm3 isoform X4 [Megachile rotundata]|uniref:POU-domain protein pdm3 isoform X4 n=1 Tax=Megachile rotundata TaxID=143995 RepID=UPI00061536C0|nr:PREDICTED: POU domain, class 6, transcription factor 2 isoform X4 [Megachile rotundata]
MAEGSPEEEQSSTAASASPPADLRTLNTQLLPPYHHQSHLQPRLQHLQHPNTLATAVPPRHSHSMLSHQVNMEAELDAPCDVPLNLKSERWWTDLRSRQAPASSTDSDRSSAGTPEATATNGNSLHEHQIMMDDIKISRKGESSPSPENLHQAKRAAEAHLNGTMAAGMVTLQNLHNLANLHKLINTPLNLTVSSSGGTVPTASSTTVSPHLLPPSPAPMGTLPQLLSQPQSAAMPQFILTSGQLVQGIQGAQLLIPTSQGIASQTILTIPVSHITNQMVNLGLNNGQVVSTTLANLQSIAQPQNMMNTPTSNGDFTVPTSPNLASGLGLNPAALRHLLSNSSTSQQLLNAMQPQQLLQAAQAAQAQTAQADQAAHASLRPLLTTSPQQHGHRHSSHMNHYTPTDKHHRERPEQSSPLNESVVSAASALNRLASSNGEITITTTHGYNCVGVKASPNSMHSSKEEEDDLIDSPNHPTINDSANNVNGFELEDIKEFAKEFKQRRLSLGLTQTQVGQSLSATEGPAYSQSAICSALAYRLLAALQSAPQQHPIFEKLDITPKSAQKIRPVLEKWMKEAEARYKNGINQLTEFIGVETSKKRKRRTSFSPHALEHLNAHFERNTHPNGNEITKIAQVLGYEREVIRIWFCNKRQSLKNTLRSVAKSMT